MLLVLPLHESAHALVAKWFGDDTAERQGRISLNPLAHLDPFGGLLMVLTGFGWAKPVPINPLRMKKYRAGISLTALAGPVSNLLAAFVAGIAYNIIICTKSGLVALVSSEVTTMSCVLLLLSFLFQVNVGLAVFNLIPSSSSAAITSRLPFSSAISGFTFRLQPTVNASADIVPL